MAASGSLLALALLWIVDRFVVGHTLALANAAGARVLVVSVPNAAYVNLEGKVTRQRLGFVLEPDTLVDEGPDESIRLAAEAASMPFVSVTDAFRRQRGARLFFPLDGHLTEEGHGLLADRLTPTVEDALAGRSISLRARRAS